jgi:DNA-binding CsgD family transcriptional regulator
VVFVSAAPASDETAAAKTAARELFVETLLVRLAESMKANAGADVLEMALAEAGADVGGALEDAYRTAHRITGRLSANQLADLYVSLKHAVGADYFVVAADERRIVLGNRRCPFGAAVRGQPGLCRLTTSVFGGIAARNRDSSSVVLEERIADGASRCRIVVWLEPTSNNAPTGPQLRLTPREREIVVLIAEGRSGPDIARELTISDKTVERHRANIKAKLGIGDRVALTRYAIRHGLVSV